MAHGRKKKKPQGLGQDANAQATGVSQTNSTARIPKSMVIRMGASDVGPSVSQLVYDMRGVMEPHTAVKLKERRSNKLRDYATMAGPLGVSHFLLFSRSSSGNTNLRIAVTPRGPTLNFRVENYSLCKDIVKSQRRPKSFGGGVEHLTPPLLVMNNFTTPDATNTSSAAANDTHPKHLESLTTSIFQSLFPPISPQRTPLSSIRRVLLLNRETTVNGTYTLHLRHYSITTKRVAAAPLSRGLRRLRRAEQHAAHRPHKPQPGPGDAGHADASAPDGRLRAPGTLPDLSRLTDVSELVLNEGYASGASDSEATNVSTDAEVEVLEAPSAQRLLSRKKRARLQLEQQGEAEEGDEGREATTAMPAPEAPRGKATKRAVRLQEIGPRMKLRLVKVEEGLCEGKVLWHEYVRRTREEEKEVERRWERKRAEKEERRRLQRENVQRKRGEKGDGEDGDDEDYEMEDGEDEWLDDEEGEMEVDGQDEEELEEEEDE